MAVNPCRNVSLCSSRELYAELDDFLEMNVCM